MNTYLGLNVEELGDHELLGVVVRVPDDRAASRSGLAVGKRENRLVVLTVGKEFLNVQGCFSSKENINLRCLLCRGKSGATYVARGSRTRCSSESRILQKKDGKKTDDWDNFRFRGNSKNRNSQNIRHVFFCTRYSSTHRVGRDCSNLPRGHSIRGEAPLP